MGSVICFVFAFIAFCFDWYSTFAEYPSYCEVGRVHVKSVVI